jgi:hypothetical protein
MLRNITTPFKLNKSPRDNQLLRLIPVTYLHINSVLPHDQYWMGKIPSKAGRPDPAVLACGKLRVICGKTVRLCGNAGESLGENWGER